MSAAKDPTERLGPGDWAVLGLLCEGDTHGFAMARMLAPGGELGRIWTVRQASVYRTLDVLVDRGLAVAVGEVQGARGPQRTLFRASREGRVALAAWLQAPVEHFRDARSSLLLKVELLRRAGEDPTPLLRAQRDRLQALADGLAEPAGAAGQHVAIWRHEAVTAGIRAIDRMLTGAAAS